MDRKQAIDAAVDAARVTHQAARDYGVDSPEAIGAAEAAADAILNAREAGVTPDEIRRAGS